MCIAKEDILSSKKKRNKLETPQSIIKGEENGFFIVNSPGRQESLKNRPCSQVAFLLLLLRFFFGDCYTVYMFMYSTLFSIFTQYADKKL